MMDVYASGELYWDTAEAAAPRWCFVLDRGPGIAPLFLDPRDASLPSNASVNQLAELISAILLKATGQRSDQVTLTLVELGQRYQFHVTYTGPEPQTQGGSRP